MILFSAVYNLRKDPFNIATEIKLINFVDQLTKDGVLFLHGGEDISPTIYQQMPVHTTASSKISKRDQLELELIIRAKELKIPIIAVCRGAQLCCAAFGGSLYQHVTNHLCTHTITTYDHKELLAAADHHQVMNLNGVKEPYELLAWDTRTVDAYTDQGHETLSIVPEVVLFPESNCLAIQPHPEWMDASMPFNKWCTEQINKYL